MGRLLVALALAACVASLVACGGGSSGGGSLCPARVAAVLGPGARAAVRSRALDVVTCEYRGRGVGGAVVRVTVDTAPQTQVRFGRWVDERGQAYLGAPRAELPQLLSGIGDGAAWVPAARELVAVGNGRLVTVLAERAARGRSPQATVVAVARAALASHDGPTASAAPTAHVAPVTAGASDRGGRASSR